MAKKNDISTEFMSVLDKYDKNITELLDGSNLSTIQFKQIVLNEFKKISALQSSFKSNPKSVISTILTCCELQLHPSQIIGEFYFSVSDNFVTVPIIGYKGLVTLLMRNDKVKKIWSEVVYEDDDFEYELGLNPKLLHIPNHLAIRNANTFKYVYSCIKIDDEVLFKVMSKKDILAIAKISKVSSNFYFNDKKDPENWMQKKTCLKQLTKLIPKSDFSVKKAIALDDNIEGGAFLDLTDDNQTELVKQNTITKKSSILDKLKFEDE